MQARTAIDARTLTYRIRQGEALHLLLYVSHVTYTAVFARRRSLESVVLYLSCRTSQRSTK